MIDELHKMNRVYQSVEVLREKDGVVVARVFCGDGSFVLKLFQKREFCREIDNYRILSSLRIPTPRIISATDKALLMEDLAADGSACRLGTKQDLDSPETAVLIAKWYKRLHQAGYGYIEQGNGMSLYEENDVITLENVRAVKAATHTAALPVWELIENHFDCIKGFLCKVKRTLTYNDFYYTNLAVARDHTFAMMFDYNLMGKGYAYADVRNVCSSLSERAAKAFLKEYGEVDPLERMVDEVASVLVDLYFACGRPQFPDWANGSLQELNTGYRNKVERLLALGR